MYLLRLLIVVALTTVYINNFGLLWISYGLFPEEYRELCQNKQNEECEGKCRLKKASQNTENTENAAEFVKTKDVDPVPTIIKKLYSAIVPEIFEYNISERKKYLDFSSLPSVPPPESC